MMGETLGPSTGEIAALETDRAGQTLQRKNAAKSEHTGNTLRDYYQLLRDSRCFRIIWIGEVSIPFNNHKVLCGMRCFGTKPLKAVAYERIQT